MPSGIYQHKKKQFCPKGHDTFICGRNVNGNCKKCQYKYEIWPKSQCVNGHEITIVGRNKNGLCNGCVQEIRNPNRRKDSTKDSRFTQLCPHGHNKDNVGRTSDGSCKMCKQEWKKTHPEISRAANIRNETNRNLRIVAWSDLDKIKKIDHNYPKGMTIDNYIPLQGDLVSGLHVDWNLQYLTKSENSRKHNNIDLNEASEWYGKILEKEGLK